jgi:hypothetical protein
MRCLASLQWVLVEHEFPTFDGTFKTLRLPAIRFASLRIFVARRYHVLLVVRFVSPIATTGGTMSLELITRCSSRDFRRGNGGAPKFLGNPGVHLLMFFDPGRATCRSPNRDRRAALAKKTTKAPTSISSFEAQ